MDIAAMCTKICWIAWSMIIILKLVKSNGINCTLGVQLETCPKGTKMDQCPMGDGVQTGFFCKACGPLTFQPNVNTFGERCRPRRNCDRMYMMYTYTGNATTDAVCACEVGFHFPENTDRVCEQNDLCGPGYGQGQYGKCVACIDSGKWSDTSNNYDACKPVTDCQKESRCLKARSNGTADNVCGPVVDDISRCDGSAMSTGLMVAVILGVIVLLLLVALGIMFYLRRRRLQQKQSGLQEGGESQSSQKFLDPVAANDTNI